MPETKSSDSQKKPAANDRENRWKQKVIESYTRRWLQIAILVIISLGCIITGALVNEFISNKTGLSNWVKYILPMAPVLIGAAILAHVLTLIVARAGKYKAEFIRMDADTKYITEELEIMYQHLCHICEVIQKVGGDRWCRWLGPISEVYEKRKEDDLKKFFENAKKIDILTPNLYEVAQHALDALHSNPDATVRMMSLHPECSAVYRRYNDMGTDLDIKNRKQYSGLIRDGLNISHDKRKDYDLNWEIKTYTAFPVMLIFRADSRFLLGFPLMGSRVRDQFHVLLSLPDSNKTSATSGHMGILDEKDEKLGVAIRDDLMRHFDKIWDENSVPWLPRYEVSRRILEVPLQKPVVDDTSYHTFQKLKINSVGHLVHSVCSPDSRINPLNLMPKDNLNLLNNILEKAGAQAKIDDIVRDYRLDKNAKGMEKLQDIVSSFCKIVLCAFTVSSEILESKEIQDSIFKKKLTEAFSYGISEHEFEFEDLSEALYLFRQDCGDRMLPIWRNVWRTISKRAEHWAR